MTKLSEIEGIGPKYAEKLNGCGISSQEQLLLEGGAPAGRKKIAKESGIGDGLILKWINRADLARVKGVGSEYADLLECAGIDTVPELAQRNAANLHAKLGTVNEEKKLVRSLPTENMVTDWIEQAKGLKRAITY